MSIFGKKPEPSPQNSSPSSPSSPSPTPAPKPEPAPAPPPAAAPRNAPSPQAPASAGSKSFLKSGCKLVGELSGAGSLECSGDFEGTIDITGDLLIGHGGTAKAELKARRISIEGRLLGNATGAEKVEVGPSGHVEGDVRAPAVQFAEGAFFEGNVEMRRAKNAAAPEAGAKEATAGKGGGSAAS